MVAASTPRGTSAVVHALSAVHLPAQWMLPAVLLAGMLASAPLAWWVARGLRAAYAARWLTDQSLMIDTLWLFQAVLLSFSLTQSIGPVGWMGLGVFGLHKVITLAGMWPAARAARARAPLRLLLLRVFNRRDAQGKAVSRRAGLMNPLVQGSHVDHLSRSNRSRRHLLQVRVPLDARIIQTPIADLLHGVEKRPDDPPGTVIMNRTEAAWFP